MRYLIMILFSFFITIVDANTTLPWLRASANKLALLSYIKNKDSLNNTVAVYLNNPAKLAVSLTVADSGTDNNVPVSHKQSEAPMLVNSPATDPDNYFVTKKLSTITNPVTGSPVNGCHYLYDADDKMHNQLGNDITMQISANACSLTMVANPMRTQCGDDGLPYDHKSMNCMIMNNPGLVPLQVSLDMDVFMKTNEDTSSDHMPLMVFGGIDKNGTSVQVVSVNNQPITNCSINNKAVGKITFSVFKDSNDVIHCSAAYDPTPSFLS